MSTTFREASEEIEDRVAKIMYRHHLALSNAAVTVGTVIVTRESKREGFVCALKDKGIDIQAKIQITSLQDRVRGMPDAKLLIDDYSWDRLSRTRQDALLDHMLEHLQLVQIKPTKRNGYATGLKRDDHDRPCMKIKPYDFRIVGFENTASRGGEASVEAGLFRTFQESCLQLLLFDPAKFTKAVADKATFSKPCRSRKHKSCQNAPGTCGCPCHGKTVNGPTEPETPAVEATE